MSKIEDCKHALQIIKDAREIINEQDNWTAQAYARTKEGRITGVNDQDAYSFCSVGAMFKASPIELNEFYTLINHLFVDANGGHKFPGISVCNDSLSHPEVLVMFDRTITYTENQIIGTN